MHDALVECIQQITVAKEVAEGEKWPAHGVSTKLSEVIRSIFAVIKFLLQLSEMLASVVVQLEVFFRWVILLTLALVNREFVVVQSKQHELGSCLFAVLF